MLTLKVIALVVVLVYVGLLFRTTTLLYTKEQSLFGSAPATTVLPDGLYQGEVTRGQGSWLGKKFNAREQTGINEFKTEAGTAFKYPFLLSFGEGVHDSHKVIKIDYNIPSNPFWLRLCLDEIVEIAPNEYLGKLHVRIFPGYPFTLTFFRLTKVT